MELTLLSETEQAVPCRLGVFAGSFAREAIAAVFVPLGQAGSLGLREWLLQRVEAPPRSAD